jgi:hypothetical protein
VVRNGGAGGGLSVGDEPERKRKKRDVGKSERERERERCSISRESKTCERSESPWWLMRAAERDGRRAVVRRN